MRKTGQKKWKFKYHGVGKVLADIEIKTGT